MATGEINLLVIVRYLMHDAGVGDQDLETVLDARHVIMRLTCA